MRYKTTLIRQVRDHVALVMPTRYIQVFKEEPRDRPLILSVKTFKGKNFVHLWILGMEITAGVAMLRSESYRVGLAIYKLSGKARAREMHP